MLPVWLRKWLFAFLIALAVAVVFRIVVARSYTVTSAGWPSSLQAGDKMLVATCTYGGRLPSVPLALPFCDYFAPLFDVKGYARRPGLRYARFPGLSRLQRFDLLVLNQPETTSVPVEHRPVLIRRLIALPGDTVVCDGLVLRINGKIPNEPPSVRYPLRFMLKSERYPLPDVVRGHVNHEPALNDIAIYSAILPPSGFRTLVADTSLKWVREPELPVSVLPQRTPFVVPQRGMRVDAGACNGFYLALKEQDRCAYSFDKEQIVFSRDFFLLLNDDRSDLTDSRTWGLVSELFIVGKPAWVWWPSDVETGRFFERIR